MRCGRRVKAVGFYVADHADNRHPGILGIDLAELNVLSERALAGPVAVRQGLVDDGDALGVRVVGFGEDAALNQRSAEDVEVSRADVRKFSQGRRSESSARPSILKGSCCARHRAADCSPPMATPSTPGIVLDAANNFAKERGALLRRAIGIGAGIVGDGNPDLRRDDSVRIEAGLDLQHAPETAEQQACANQQDERERDLGDDQEARYAGVAAAGARAAAAFAQTCYLICAGGLKRGNEAEQYSRRDRKEEGKNQNAGADVDFAEAREIVGSEPQQRGPIKMTARVRRYRQRSRATCFR